MERLIHRAAEVLGIMQAQCRRPVVMCSFGKDSMVLLHLVKTFCETRKVPMWPVLFHREPFHQEKYHFSNEVIEEWGLTVYDYPANATALGRRGGLFELLNFYQVGNSQGVVPTGIDPDSEERIARGEKFLCGRDDLLRKPLGGFHFPWDGAAVGHKSSDHDPMWGDLTLHTDVRQMPGGADWFFPLRNWTDEDVWEYTDTVGIPIHHERYEQVVQGEETFWRERDDKSENPDYFPACMRCLNRGGELVVDCPKLGLQITNVGDKVTHVDLSQLDYFGGGKL